MRKIVVPTDSCPEFELGDTAVNIQQRGRRGGQKEEGVTMTATEGGAGKGEEARAEKSHLQ